VVRPGTAAVTELLQADIKLAIPPLPVPFTGHDGVTRFLAQRAFAEAGDVQLGPAAANG
jgi:RNA polymerase sigma-70 factor, ECF subfamily